MGARGTLCRQAAGLFAANCRMQDFRSNTGNYSQHASSPINRNQYLPIGSVAGRTKKLVFQAIYGFEGNSNNKLRLL